jgi:23S rRNA A1618 N6-methylase RlmF
MEDEVLSSVLEYDTKAEMQKCENRKKAECDDCIGREKMRIEKEKYFARRAKRLYAEGKKFAEIAAIMKKSKAQVRRWVYGKGEGA